MTDLKRHLLFVFLLLGLTTGFGTAVPAQEFLRADESMKPGDASPAKRGFSGVEAGFNTRQDVGETITIHVIGRGVIYSDNVARARDNAIAEALQNVVEQAISMLISPSSIAQDFQLLSDQVYNQTDAFIDGYKVLIESKSGKYYRVLVRATVSMNAIQERLSSVGILTMNEGTPAVMFFLSEQNIGDPSPKSWWTQTPLRKDLSAVEIVFSEYMRGKGFIVVDRTALDRNVQLRPEYMTSELSNEAAARIGMELGADLVIVGRAVTQDGGTIPGDDRKSIRASVSTRAVMADTGMMIASSQGTESLAAQGDAAEGREALVLAASTVAQDLTRQIVGKWGEAERQSVLVELVVKGIKEYAEFVRFRRHLSNDIRGVRNVNLRSIGADGATMDVDMIGNARLLADELMLQPFENLAVNIFEVSENGVKLELIPSRTPDS